MKIISDNTRIIKAQYILEQANGDKNKMIKAMQRVSEMIASICLGRNFNQSIEDYISSKPELQEFKNWSEKVVISSNYQLVNY